MYTLETRVNVDPITFVNPSIVDALCLAHVTEESVSAVSPDWLTAKIVLSILTDLPCCSVNSEAYTG